MLFGGQTLFRWAQSINDGPFIGQKSKSANPDFSLNKSIQSIYWHAPKSVYWEMCFTNHYAMENVSADEAWR